MKKRMIKLVALLLCAVMIAGTAKITKAEEDTVIETGSEVDVTEEKTEEDPAVEMIEEADNAEEEYENEEDIAEGSVIEEDLSEEESEVEEEAEKEISEEVTEEVELAVYESEDDVQHAEPFAYTGETVSTIACDGSAFGMYTPQEGTKAVRSGDTVKITYFPKNTSVYINLFFGTKDLPETWEDQVKLDAEGKFEIEVPLEYCGYAVPVVPVKADGVTAASKQYYLGIPTKDKLGVEEDEDPEPDPEVPVEEKIKGDKYKINVTSSAAMFKVIDAVLYVKDGKLTSDITLSGTGYDYLYTGTAREAEADNDNRIPFEKNSEGKYIYTIPVSALDEPIAVAAHSISKDLWYNRTLTFDSSSMEKIESGDDEKEDPEGPDPEPTPEPSPVPSPTPAPTPEVTPAPGKEQDKTPDSESQHEADTSGTTGAVNNSTGLKDGVYTPDSFSFSGGTGKVGISCPKITVEGGQTYATLVFSSSSYQYVKAAGNKYYTSPSGSGAQVVIPVQLNQNNRIIAMTTKMSAVHEIEYSVFIYLAAAQGADAANVNAGAVGTDNAMDEKAPEILGLKAVEDEKEYKSDYLKIFKYENGIRLVEIDMTKNTVTDPEYLKKESDGDAEKETSEDTSETKNNGTDETVQKPEKTLDEIAADLYKKDVVKYLIIPEGTEIPAGLDKQVIVINIPVKSAYASSEETLKSMEELGLLENITSVGFEEKDCKNEELKKAFSDKELVFGGSFDDIDSKTLVKQKTDIVFESSVVMPLNKEYSEELKKAGREKKSSEEKELSSKEYRERLYKMTDKMAVLGIPFIVDRSSDEISKEAQAEWILLYGALYSCEDEAQKLYEERLLTIKG